ncbi:MAG: hypothetical protein LBL82_04385 [Oscillospiraceae bacterium]|jgi:hypothetical protein|nr:hypothetical protein [Oscillospiraceae bacterium]
MSKLFKKNPSDSLKQPPSLSMKERMDSSVSGTPVELLSTVLHHRYSIAPGKHSSDSIPDLISFPAMQKALGTLYSDFMSVVESENAGGRMNEEEFFGEGGEIQASEIPFDKLKTKIEGISSELVDMIGSIEQEMENKRFDEEFEYLPPEPEDFDPYNRKINVSSIQDTEHFTEISIKPKIVMEKIEGGRNGQDN